jgi:hypothetical protein
MKLSALISPGTWELLEHLRPHLDIAIDLFDNALQPLLPASEDTVAQCLRGLSLRSGADAGRDDVAPSPGDRADAAARFHRALETANTQLFSSGDLRIGLFPLRHHRTIVGVLAAAATTPRWDVSGKSPDSSDGGAAALGGSSPDAIGVTSPDATPSGTVADTSRRAHPDGLSARLERLGWSLRATIEGDIDTHERLGHEQHQARWLSATLRFLEHLHACQADGALALAMVQAGAIWGDLDARLYRRDADDSYRLHTALPSLADGIAARILPAHLIDRDGGAVRITSIAELEHLGWSETHGEVLCVPAGGHDRRPDWVLAVAGVVDAQFERVLSVACQTFALRCDSIATARRAQVCTRLRHRLARSEDSIPAQVTEALAEFATAAGATQARLLAREAADGPLRLLAAIGGSIGGTVVPPACERVISDQCVSIPFAIGAEIGAVLELRTVNAQPFHGGVSPLVEDAAGVLAVWLSAVLREPSRRRFGLDVEPAPSAFERRVKEELARARRFGLQVGLVVIDTPRHHEPRHALVLTPLIEVIRGHLREADVLGRLTHGQLAALLVQTPADGLEVVAVRLATACRAVATEGGPWRLGRAAYPRDGEAAATLIAAARADASRLGSPASSGRAQ